MDRYDQYKAIGVSYGFLDSEFKVSYIFSGQYNWLYYDDLGGSSNMPYIGYLNFTTNMQITGSSYATNGQTYGASVWMIICPAPTYETNY
ncbi:hypothetical protein DMB44_09110 [Thermoplasma sp. Kam2015]|nr:hypothetical protein DMB44_09110 [Thermoplasma sp. Kam2015]